MSAHSDIHPLYLDNDSPSMHCMSRYMSTMGEGWTAFRLQRLGQWNEANTRTFPLTTEIIRGLNIPLAVRGVMFAKQVRTTIAATT